MNRAKSGLSLAILVILLFSGFIPLGPLPPLFGLLNPSSGIWVSEEPYYIGSTNLVLTQGANHAAVTVFRQSDGFIGIAANETWAMYYEQGYTEAQYRLAQMEFLLLTAVGNLSSVAGSQAVSSDVFFRELGNYRTAEIEAANLSRSGYTYMALSEFVRGINYYITSANPARMPLIFKLLGFTPANWTVTDVLALEQLFLWENTAAQFDPLYFTYALEKMPEQVVHSFYPAYPAGIQHPIVPVQLNPVIYTEPGNIRNLTMYTPTYHYPLNDTPPDPSLFGIAPNLTFGEANHLINVTQLVLGLRDFGSNDWAVRTPLTGSSVSGGSSSESRAILSNDPHLSTTVPSIWMGFQLVSPGENAVGVVFPGFPGVVLGHNPYVAWGATNGQIQQTYFYAETTSASRPGEYYMDGSWHPFLETNESIAVKGAGMRRLIVLQATNGVVIQEKPITITLDWVGLRPSYEVSFFLKADSASSVSQFRSLLERYFRVAIQNWAVADSQGNIGIFSYGEYPIISQGDPRGILPGTGAYNWIGFVNLSYQPFLYNPPTGFVFSANQITVSSNYPYYVGWDYESGFRADEIFSTLSSAAQVNDSNMIQLQLSIHDYSTDVFLKPLLAALSRAGYASTPEYQALSSWNGDMYTNSSAATIYYFWLRNYISFVFSPWLRYYNITPAEGLGSSSFFLGADDYYHGPLIEDLENWTANYTNTRWFSNPLTGETANASSDLVEAYAETMSNLTSTLGAYSAKWDWGNVHTRVLASFFGIAPLNTRPLAAPGDGNTVNAAYGLQSNFGPSWRMVVDMSAPQNALGIYPGGASESPVSAYYSNTFLVWNEGNYYRLIPADAPEQFFYLYRVGISP